MRVDVCIEVKLDAGGVEERYQSQGVLGNAGAKLLASLFGDVDVVATAQQVFLGNVDDGVVNQSETARTDGAVLVGGIEQEGRDGNTRVGQSRPLCNESFQINVCIQRHADVAFRFFS